MGLYALCGVLQWRLERPLNLLTASMLLFSAYLLMWYPLGVVYHLLGAALLVAVILWQRYQTRQEQKSHDRQVSG
jgi:Flp pilus assembly protein TadB